MHAQSILIAAAVLVAIAAVPAGGNVAVSPSGDHYVGDVVTISGNTTFSPGNRMLVEVEPLSFGPTNKSDGREVSGVSGIAEVESRNGVNSWSFQVDTTGFAPGDYLVRVEVLEAGAVETTTFTLYDRPPAAETPVITGTPSPVPETTTAAPVTEPTRAGSEFLPTAAGACAVAAVLLKRRG
jgi:hypothetical protein